MPCDFAFPEPPSTRPSTTARPKPEPVDWDALLTDFLTAGYSEGLFWSLTPRQIERHFKAADRRTRRAHNDRMEQAYITALLPNQKHPLKLQKLLVPLDAPKARVAQTADEMLAMARRWDAALNRKRD